MVLRTVAHQPSLAITPVGTVHQVMTRRLPIGAEVQPDGGVHFRVWAPRRRCVEVVLEGDQKRKSTTAQNVIELAPEKKGYFSFYVPKARTGTRYRFRLDGDDRLLPDPASRFQPDGPHGPSQVIDPTLFSWTDAGWRGVDLEGQVLYELHVGTFTREGTWEAASRELPELANLGITVIEVMPVAEFPGRFGWGYDGVNLFAPTRLYGSPDDFRRFVDRAHSAGLAVILDVVYNHLGPDGNYLHEFSTDYFTDRYTTEWGDPINFDGKNAGPVREFFLANAGYWIEEFHLDGLRLDATQCIFDNSPAHILSAITQRVREAGGDRSTLLIAENEPQQVKMVLPIEEGGHGIDALWNDDFHHSATVALTGRNEAYFTDYQGTPQEFISAVKRGFLYQGQRYAWQQKRRGTSTRGLKPATFVTFTQNHDQIANLGRGLRHHQTTSPGRYRAMTSLLLLTPGTPMIFQGQEFAASSPFHYFADHKADLAKLVRVGRAAFMQQFPSIAAPEMAKYLIAPDDPASFECCKLDFGERERHAGDYALHRDLLKLRLENPIYRTQRPCGIDGAVLGPEAFVLRFFADDVDGSGDRLLIVNLGRDLQLTPAPEPLLAPPEHMFWQAEWSSEDPRYGGSGTPPVEDDGAWYIPGNAAIALRPVQVAEDENG